MRMLLAAILLVQAAPTQSEADKLEAALKKFGERTYRMTAKGDDASSTVTLKTRIEKEGDRKVVVLEDRISFDVYGSEITITNTEKASLDGLKLISAKTIGQFSTGKTEGSAEIRDGKAHMTSEGQKLTVDVTDGVKGTLAGARLVCAAEQKKDAAFKIDVFDWGSGRFEPGHSFRCAGQEPVTVGKREVLAYKWEVTGEWKHVTHEKAGDKERTKRVNITYWVGPDGYPVRFTNDKHEAVLVEK